MVPYQHVITTPNAWTSQSIGGKAALTCRLTPDRVGACDALLAQTLGRLPQDAGRADFDHPAINALMATVAQTIRHGRGAILLAGPSPERFSADDDIPGDHPMPAVIRQRAVIYKRIYSERAGRVPASAMETA